MIEALNETVLETEMLFDLIELSEIVELRVDFTDADENDDILYVAIDERDNNGEDVDDKEATDERLK